MPSNSAALAALDGRIASLSSVPSALPEIAQRAVVEIRRTIAANIAAQTGPDGAPWPATKDGRPALERAMRSIAVRAEGASIVISVGGVENRHHLGAVPGGTRRPLIPSGAIPASIVEQLDRVALEVLARHLNGGVR